MPEKKLIEAVRTSASTMKPPRVRSHAVEGVNFTIEEGTTLGVVGESGCGKSTLGRTIMNLHDSTSGKILFDGEDVTHPNKAQKKMIHKNIQMIFQDPASRRWIPRKCVSEPADCGAYEGHEALQDGKAELAKRTWPKLMDTVGLATRRYAFAYPHELDGGRRQRIGIARALALRPEVHRMR